MAALTSRVDMQFPVSVVALIGVLDAETAVVAQTVVRECLAEIPAAVIIDATDLALDANGWNCLAGLTRAAQMWPGVPLALAGGFAIPNGHQPIHRYSSVAAAMASLGHAVSTDRRQMTLPPEASSCGQARELVARACTEWGLPRPRRVAELLVSELVANAVRHAGTQFQVTVRRHGEGLEVSVHDHDPSHLPPLQRDPRGFGLQLVDQLSDSWGWVPTGRGKVVWTRLPGVGSV